MAIFLTRAQLYRMMQRELPEGVYPDGTPSAFFSTASIDSKSAVLKKAYDNLERIYANYFPETADEKIDDWVVKMFGKKFNGSVTLEEKRARVIAKVRKQPQIALWEVLTLVAGYIPEGKYVQIIQYCDFRPTPWMLGVSKLGLDTYLGFTPALDELGVPADEFCDYVGNLHWRLGQDRLGVNTFLSSADITLIQKVQLDAYGYEIRIFDHEVTGLDLENMREDIHKTEPARSSFVLKQNQNLLDFNLTVPVTDVDQFDLVDCITRDPASSTGYSGLKES